MSIAFESEPQHEVIDINAERSRLRTELNINPETVVTLPVSYEVATPISQDEIESFRAKDAEVAQRHESTREELAAIGDAITRLHERDVTEVDKSKSEAEKRFKALKEAHELDFQRRVRAAEELMYREIQNDAYDLDVIEGMNDTKLHASEILVQATGSAIHQTNTAVEGGSTVRQQHIEHRESLITYLNQLTERFNVRANQVTQAEGRIVVLNEDLTEDEQEKDHLFREGKKLRAKDTKIRTQMSESDPRMQALRTQIQLNEESENIKEIFSNIRADQESDELNRIIGDLKINAEAIRAVDSSISAKQRSLEADELIIENATNELNVLAEKIVETRAKYEHEIEVVAPQLEKQSVAVLSRTAILKTMIGGNTTHLASKDSYKLLEPVEEAMRAHSAALAMESDAYVKVTKRPVAYAPDDESTYMENFEVKADLDHTELRIETSDGIGETLRAIAKTDIVASVVDRAVDYVDVATSGVLRKGRRMLFRQEKPTEK